jgi:phosphatidylglycerophosphate synthase
MPQNIHRSGLPRTLSNSIKMNDETVSVVKLHDKVKIEKSSDDFSNESVLKFINEASVNYTKETNNQDMLGLVSAKNTDNKNDIDRVNKSILSIQERRLLNWLVVRMPTTITPNQLSLIGLAGAIFAGISFAACNFSNLFILPAALGIVLNWFGDSLDGSLARYRKIERPEYGYLIDHSIDLIANTFMFLGLGLSPYFTLFSALMAMAMYFLFSAYTYLKVVVKNTHNLSYGSMGATELRILMIFWSVFAMIIGPKLLEATAYDYRIVDIVIGSLWICVLLGLFLVIAKELSAIWIKDDNQLEETTILSSKKDI